MLAFIIAYILGLIGYLIYQRLAKKRSLRQTERELGPESHKKKNGTITGGGIVFVVVTSLVFFIAEGFSFKVFFLIGPFILYFLIGFFDDILIIKKKNNDGLSPKCKLILETIIAIVFCGIYYLIDGNQRISIQSFSINLGFCYSLFIIFVYAASANTFNITDGLDGLLVGLSLEILLALFVIAYKQEEHIVMSLIIILIASMSSFYFFNYPSAYIFMGDSGSLALGAIVTSIAIYLKVELLYIIMALPLIFETISVILQVLYFKITKGKRLFKMAPFHHHLEFLGYSEKMITSLFMLVEVILILVSLYLYGVF